MNDFAWHFANIFFSRAVVVLFSILLAKWLPPAEVGKFSALILLVSYVQSFSGLQLSAGIVQKLNDERLRASRDIYFTAGLLLTCVLAMIAAVVGVSVLPWLGVMFQLQADHVLIVVGLSLVLWRMLKDYFGRTLQANGEFRRAAIINFSTGLIQVGALVALLAIERSLWMAIAALYVGTVVSTLLLGSSAWRYHRVSVTSETLGAGTDLLRLCAVIYIAGIAVFLDTKIDVILVNYYLTKEDLALYSYAVEMALILTMIGDTITQVIYPRLARAFSEGLLGEVDRNYRQAMTFSFIVVAVSALLVIVHAETLIPWVLSEFYAAMIPALVVLCAGIVLFATVSSVGTMLTAKGVPIYDAAAVWVSLAVNVVLNVLLIPMWGILGAAAATTTSFVVRGIAAVFLIEWKVGTSYKYTRLAVMYVMFLACVAAARLISIDSLWYREMIVAGFALVCLLFLCEPDQRRMLSVAFHLPGGKQL